MDHRNMKPFTRFNNFKENAEDYWNSVRAQRLLTRKFETAEEFICADFWQYQQQLTVLLKYAGRSNWFQELQQELEESERWTSANSCKCSYADAAPRAMQTTSYDGSSLSEIQKKEDQTKFLVGKWALQQELEERERWTSAHSYFVPRPIQITSYDGFTLSEFEKKEDQAMVLAGKNNKKRKYKKRRGRTNDWTSSPQRF